MKFQKGSTAYNRQWKNGGVGRTIRLSRDPRSAATRPVWLSEPLPAVARWLGRAIA